MMDEDTGHDITCSNCGADKGNDIDGQYSADWPCCVTVTAPSLIVSELVPLRSLIAIHFTAAEIVASLDEAFEDWDAGSVNHEARHEAMANIWEIAEAQGVADDAKHILYTR